LFENVPIWQLFAVNFSPAHFDEKADIGFQAIFKIDDIFRNLYKFSYFLLTSLTEMLNILSNKGEFREKSK